MLPINANYRKRYEAWGLPIGRACVRLGLSADAVTLLSLAFGAAAAGALAYRALGWAVVFGLLMGVADALDGAVARASGTASPAGTLLDHVVDRYVEALLLLGAALGGLVAPGWVIMALTGMLMASYVRARAESTGLVPNCNVGAVGRIEKMAILLIGLVLEMVLPQYQPLTYAMIACGILSHITAIQRLLYARRVMRAYAHSRDE